MKKALEAEDLSYSINGAAIFRSVSFSLECGSLTVLCGPNGAGKSQLLRAVKGLQKPEGRILLGGIEAGMKERMKRIGLVFQNARMQIVSQSVERDIAFGPENMGLAKEEVRRRVEASLSMMGLEDKAGQDPQTLSGGELRKCAIAGVLAMEPDVILLDEPFANLDYPGVVTVIKALIRLRDAGYAILAVSHEAEKFLAHADELLIMQGGVLKEKGPAEKLYALLPSYDVYIPANASFGDLTWLR